MYRKVKVSERLPDPMKWVTTIDSEGNHFVHRLTDYGWNMRDAGADNTPDTNYSIEYWLEEIKQNEMVKDVVKLIKDSLDDADNMEIVTHLMLKTFMIIMECKLESLETKTKTNYKGLGYEISTKTEYKPLN